MKKTITFIFCFLLLITSTSASAFSFSSSDFGMDDDDYRSDDCNSGSYGAGWGGERCDHDSWGDSNSPMSMSSGKWNTGRWGGGPFNTDSRDWGGAPWNGGGRNRPWGGSSSPWNSTPSSGNNRDWRNNSGPWNRGYRGYGYGNPYSYPRGPYGAGYGGYAKPYNAVPGSVPNLPQTPGSDVEKKQ